MPSFEDVVVVGPGAAGLVLAGSLAAAGRRVRLLARNAARAERLRGLSVDGRPLRVDAVLHGASAARACGLAAICVKSYDTAAAIRAARPFVGPETAVLSLQNGLAHVALLRRAFGSRVVFAAAYFGARLDGAAAGRLGGDRIDLGASGRNQPLAERLSAELRRAGWKSRVAPEGPLLWTKLLLNASINPLGALADCANGELLERPALKDLLQRAAREAAALCPVKPLGPKTDRAAVRLCKATAANLNSMARDVRGGRPTEADSILLPLLRQARHPADEAPVLFGFYRFLKNLERRR
jgi:2-dehydropantoate 2-reductase